MTPPIDKTFRVLADQTRRRVLLALLEHNPQSDTALHPIDDVGLSHVEIQRLKVEMYHNHLPMLEEAGLTNWNRDTHEVVKGPNFEEIRPILSLLKDDPDTVTELV